MAAAVVARTKIVAGELREAQHLEPIWRDRSDFIIAADVSSYSAAVDFEQLWARRLVDDRFEICCIPFFVYDLALGDVVETGPRDGRRFVVRRVVEHSGRCVFRVWFGESMYPREEVAGELARRGALLEWSSLNLLAIDARDASHAEEIASYLAVGEAEGRFRFETGRSS